MVKRLQYPIWATIDPETLDAQLRDEVQWRYDFSIPVLPLHQVRQGLFITDPETLGEAGRAPDIDATRTVNILGESRTVAIIGESRALAIIGESRTLSAIGESRTVAIIGESRTVTAIGT